MLDEQVKNKLILAAKEAQKHAYAPYSRGFRVGAAVLTKDGEIFCGCNIENASFGATICAERVAVFKAVCEGYREIIALALVTDSSDPDTPCGLCLQVLTEFGKDTDVIMANTEGVTKLSTVNKLMPESFKFRG